MPAGRSSATPSWLLFVCVAGAMFAPRQAASAPSPVTFTKDVAPILWSRCASCHRPGDVAPFSLIDYADVFPRARQIAAAVERRSMPPWLPGEGGRFKNERRLETAEIETIVQWVRDGAPRGQPSDLPPTPAWTDGWQLGTPDLIVEAPEPFMLVPGAADVFRNFTLPIPLDRTRWVRGIEVRPGNRRVVHHASISVDRTRASRRLDEADPAPGFGGGMFAETAQSPDSRALGWTPGRQPSFEPDGMAWRLEKGSDLVVQLHMIASSITAAERVRPSVALYFSPAPPTRLSMDFKLGSRDIDMAPGDAGYSIEDQFTLPVDVDLMNIYPHAHYLAKDVRAEATVPGGRVLPLLWIRDWDFHWQDDYEYAQPVFLPRGSVLRMRYLYDNSAANRHNPRRAPERVVYGPQSNDEMGDLWLRFSPRSTPDAVMLANAYREHERGKALRLNERMVAAHPADPTWRNALGASYLDAERLAEGVGQLQEALRLAPDHAQARNNLGQAFRRQGKPREAIAELREAVRLAPQNDVLRLNLGNAFEDNGDLAEAIGEFEQALALNPSLAEAHNNMGIALGALGRLDDAARQFRLALDVQPDHQDAARNLAVLEEMRSRTAPR